MHEFVFLVNGEKVTVNQWEDVPTVFDHVIKFLPEIPPEPHTEEQHKEIEMWPGRLQQLMEKENAGNH
tara:strand:- start:2191 stop:2394 length:204 start_codon:yes stop_codon:yes gene_type:complete